MEIQVVSVLGCTTFLYSLYVYIYIYTLFFISVDFIFEEKMAISGDK